MMKEKDAEAFKENYETQYKYPTQGDWILPIADQIENLLVGNGESIEFARLFAVSYARKIVNSMKYKYIMWRITGEVD